MNKKGPIILVEDDPDDQEMLIEVFRQLKIKNEIIMLPNGEEAYEYLNNKHIDPFLIISDINMPKMNGTELKEKIQQEGEVRLRTIPFLFLTTGSRSDHIINAYARSVQGFFVKPSRFEDLKRTFSRIIDYWSECTEPTFRHETPG